MIDIEKMMKRKSVSKFDIDSIKENSRFPIEVFPEDLQYIIYNLYKKAGFEKQVTASSILFVVSTIIGNSKIIEVKDTWKDTPNLWISIVGRRGTMKSPSISYCLKPLIQDENEYSTKFDIAMREWLSVPKKHRKDEERPKRQQRFSNDTTVEGMIDAMEWNPNGMGIYKDELNGFFEEMNRYKSGGNLEFYLSAFNGGTYIKNRKSYDPQTIKNVFLSMLGSIQPEVLKSIASTQTNNGMIDRWLYVISDNIISNTSLEDIDSSVMNSYMMKIATIANACNNRETLTWLPGAKESFIENINEFEDIMRNESTDDNLVTYLSKMRTYMARFVAILTVIDGQNLIGIPQVQNAKLLSAYFINTAIDTFIGFENQITLDKIYAIEKATTKIEKVIAIVKHLPELNNSQISKLSNISRPTVIKGVNKCKQGVNNDSVDNQ